MAAKQKIMIVDDDSNIAELIALYLNKECFDTRIVGDGEAALRSFDSFAPNLILLDLMLPGMDGYQVCREIRQRSNVPIIMLSAKGEIFDKVLGLELGADDYIIKPFDSKELVARVKAVLRRFQPDKNGTDKPKGKIVEYPDLIVNQTNYSVIYRGKTIDMPPKELELLYFLAASPNQVFTREQLLELKRVAKENHVELIPLVQCFSHWEYILKHDAFAGIREDQVNVSQGCPLNPGTFEVFRSMLGEILELHDDCRFVHIGGDEARLLGHCPECAEKVRREGVEKLYGDYLERAIDEVNAHGRTPLFWADFFWHHEAPLIRRNCIAVDWEYAPRAFRSDKTYIGIDTLEYGGARNPRYAPYLKPSDADRTVFAFPHLLWLRDHGYRAFGGLCELLGKYSGSCGRRRRREMPGGIGDLLGVVCEPDAADGALSLAHLRDRASRRRRVEQPLRAGKSEDIPPPSCGKNGRAGGDGGHVPSDG